MQLAAISRRAEFVKPDAAAIEQRPHLMKMIQLLLHDGSSKEFPGSVPVKDVAAAIGPRLLKAAIAAEVDGKIVGLDYKLPADGEVKVRVLTAKDPEALGVMRHSAAHVMARAVMR